MNALHAVACVMAAVPAAWCVAFGVLVARAYVSGDYLERRNTVTD